MTPELLNLALEHAKRSAPREACALLIEAQGEPFYWRCENVSGEPDMAIPAFKDMVNAEDSGRLLGFVHSHPAGPTTLSPLDLKGSAAMQLPWWVVNPSDGTWTRYDPPTRELLGRQFVLGVDDCWSLCRDWYRRERALDLPDFTRGPGFWESGFEPHLDHMDEAGFQVVAFDSLRAGDTLLFKLAARTITHSAIYLGDGVMLHHLDKCLSRTEHINQSWLRRLVKVARRKEP